MDKYKVGALLTMLHEAGKSWEEIASTLDMSADQLRIFRYKMGLDGHHYRGLTADKLADVRRMRKAGKSWPYIESQTGYSASWMRTALRTEETQ